MYIHSFSSNLHRKYDLSIFLIGLHFALCSLISQTIPFHAVTDCCHVWAALWDGVLVCPCVRFLNECMCGFKHTHIGKPICVEMKWNDQSCWVFVLLSWSFAFAFRHGRSWINLFFLQAFYCNFEVEGTLEASETRLDQLIWCMFAGSKMVLNAMVKIVLLFQLCIFFLNWLVICRYLFWYSFTFCHLNHPFKSIYGPIKGDLAAGMRWENRSVQKLSYTRCYLKIATD